MLVKIFMADMMLWLCFIWLKVILQYMEWCSAV